MADSEDSVQVGGRWPFRLTGTGGIAAGIIGLLMLVIGFYAWVTTGLWGPPFNLDTRLKLHETALLEFGAENTFFQACALQFQQSKKLSTACEDASAGLSMPESIKRKLRANGR